MPKFVVSPHFRLQEWVAEEKGYFVAEGLDYEFREALDSRSGGGHQLGNKVGAYQMLEAGVRQFANVGRHHEGWHILIAERAYYRPLTSLGA